MDAVVAGELRMKGGRQQIALAYGDDTAIFEPADDVGAHACDHEVVGDRLAARRIDGQDSVRDGLRQADIEEVGKTWVDELVNPIPREDLA